MAREMTLSTTFILATELAVLVGTGIAMAFPGSLARQGHTPASIGTLCPPSGRNSSVWLLR